MSALLRQLLLLAVAGVASWWLLLRAPGQEPASEAERRQPPTLSVALLPSVEEPAPAPPEPAQVEEPAPVEKSAPVEESAQAEEPEPEPEPAPQPSPRELELPESEPEVEPEPAPPPPELGAPEGDPELDEAPTPEQLADQEAAAEAPPEEPTPEEPDDAARPDRPAPAELMRDRALLEAAREEFAGEVRQGFATQLLSSPEEQLGIARALGEELVLVPLSGIDPDAERPAWYRLTTGERPRVERVEGRPPLDRYRQYRDLFEYEYARLPEPLRELRRAVLSRSEVYLFAALIPLEEWALVVGRRREALAAAGRPLEDVRRFVVRYVRTGDAYDVRVEEIVFADGTRFRPPAGSSSPFSRGASPRPDRSP